MAEPQIKYDRLLHLLQGYPHIGVAYSGGVDSTLLVHACLEALGVGNVRAFYLLSSVLATDSVQKSRSTFADNFPASLSLYELAVDPLDWEEFVANDRERCYYCKRKMYTAMKAAAASCGIAVLADGTNLDDLQECRPGLRAIQELGVITPLVAAGLCKADIRRLAKSKGLTNFSLPSDSCLATRIPSNRKIDREILALVEQAEDYLHQLGFYGCRVRVLEHFTMVEAQAKDLPVIIEHRIRAQVLCHFATLGLGQVVLSLVGR